MNDLASAATGAGAVAAAYLVAFFGSGFVGAVLESFSRSASDSLFRLVWAAFGFWPETAVLPQVFVVIPLVALVAVIPAYGALRVLAPGLEGSESFWLCFVVTLALTRVAYLFLRP